MKILLSVVVTIIVLVLAGMIISLRYYDVSAMNPDGRLNKWFFTKVKDNSIKRNAANITIPSLGDSIQVGLGFMHFDEMCVTCHGAPGIDRSESGEGLNPMAPDLTRSVKNMSDAELYWVIKNGIKMTGMPSFGKTHSEEQLWAIVSFVRLLPNMTPEQYQFFAKVHQNMDMEGMDMDKEEHHQEE